MKQGALQPRMRALSWRLGALALFLTLTSSVLAQCPNVYDQDGNVVPTPYWISCSGTSFTLSLQPSSPWGAFDINWGDGSAHTTGNSWTSPTIIQHTYNAVVDTFQLTITQLSNGCTVNGVVVVEQATNASIQVPIGAYTSVCAPATVDFVNSSTNVSETTVFTWDFGDGTPPLTFDYTNWLQTVSHLYADAALIDCQTTVSLTASNYCNVVNGSPSVATFTPVNIWTIDQANISVSNTTLCNPSNTFTFTNTTIRNCYNQGNTFQRQEMWNFGDYWGLGHDSIVGWNPFPPSLPQTITFPGVGDYTIILYDSSYCGLDSASITVHVIEPPVASISLQPAIACVGQQVTFYNQSSGNGQSYLWNFGTNNNWSNQGSGNVTYTYNSPGTYTVSAVAYFPGLGSSCRDTATVQVTVLPAPTAVVIANPTQACDSALVVLSSQTTNANTYSWNLGGGFGTFNGQYPDTLLYNNPGTYTVTLTVTSTNGCTAQDSQTIRIYASPNPSFTANTPCVGQPVNFTNTSSSGASGSGNQIVSRNWNFGDGGTSTQNNPNHTYNTAGTYNVSLTVNTQHCSASVTEPITVNPAPVASFTLSQTSGCQPVHVVFTNTSVGATSFNWNFGDGQSSTLENPVHDFYYNSSSNHTFTVTLTVTNQYGCTDTQTHTVTVLGGPVAAIGVGSTAIGCVNSPIQFSNNSTGESSILWDFGDGTTSTQNNPFHTFNNTTGFIQNYTVTLTAYSSGGCTGMTTVQVPVYPILDLQVSTPPQAGCSPYTFQSPVFPGVQGYAWDFGDGSTSTLPFPSHTYVNTTGAVINYTVNFVGTSAFGCTDSLQFNIAVSPQAIASITADPTGGCSPLTVQINSNSINASSLAWNFGDGTTSTSATNTHVFNNNTGTIQTYVVTLIANSVGNCPDTTAIEIPVFPSIDVTLPVTNVGGCSPYVFQAPTATGAQQFLWNFGDGTSSTLPFPIHIYNNATSAPVDYTVHFIGSNGFGCSDSADIQVHVLPQAVAQISAAPVGGCSPVTVNFQSTSVNASNIAWNFGDGQTSTATSVSHTFVNTTNSVITYQVQLIANANGGCNDTTYIDIPVYPALDLQMPITSAAGCSPFIFQSPSFTGVQTFNWNFGDGTSSSLPFPTHVYTNTTSAIQNYTIHFVGANGYGCSDSADIAVAIYPQAVAQISATPAGGCSPVTVNFQSTSLNASSVAWNFGDGQTSTANSVSHTFVNTTNSVITYQVQLIAYANGGCNDTMYVDIPVYPALDLQMPITSAAGCSPFIFQSPSFTGVQTFNWNFGDGTSSSLPFPTHVYTNTTSAIQNYTIHFVGANGYGCADSADIAVMVYPQAVAQIQMNPNSGCSPLVVDLTSTSTNASSLAWSFSNGGTSTATMLSHTFVNTTTGIQTFTIQLIANALGGCSDTTQLQVPVYPSLDMVVPVTSVQGCSPLTFFAPQISGVQSYNWNFGDGTSSSLPYPIHIYNNTTGATENFTIHLVGTSGYGCSDSTDIPVTVLPQAVASIVADPTIGCSPLPVDFVSNSQNATSLNWNFGDGTTSTASTVSHVFPNTTDLIQLNTVTLIANNSFGCADTTGIQIPVYPELNLTANNDPQNGCSPYTFLVPSMAGVQTYFWDFGDGFTSNIPYPVHAFSNTSNQVETHVVHFVGTSGFGCSDSLDFVVTVQPEVTADIQANVTNGCGPLEVTFTNNSTNASGFIWSYGNGGSSNTNLITHNVVYSNGTTVPQTFQVSLLANQSNGCTDVDTLTVTVYPNSAAGFNFAGVGCSPLSVSFNNTSSFGTTAHWDFGDGTTSDDGYPSHTFYANGFSDTSYDISLIATNSFGCADTIHHPVTVLYSPVAAGGIASVSGCYPLNVVLTNSSQGASSYLWNYGNGITSTTNAVTHEYDYFNLSDQTQTYTITLTATAPNGCSAVIDTVVSVLPQITADADVYVSGCNPVSAVFNNQSIGATSFFWDFGNGNTSTNANENQLFYNSGTTDTTFTVTLTATNNFNCSVDHQYLVLVHPLPEALFTVSPELQTWPENEVTIVNNSFGTNLGYHWSFGDGTQAFDGNPGIHEYLTWGTFNIELIVNQGVCTDTLVKPITIIPPAALASFDVQAEGCAPVVVTLQNASDFAAGYLWIFGDGGTSTATNPTYTYWTAGTYSITLIAYGFDGGSDTLVVANAVVVYPNANAAFTVTPNEVSIPSQPVYLLNLSTAATSYQWSFGDGETSTLPNPIHYYQAEGNYNIQLIANNQYNCPDTLTYYNVVHAVGDGMLDYPNAFTPNHNGQGDGIYDPIGYSNDIFCPLHKGVTSYQLQIFNKWGELLFETDNVHVGWDGYYRGQLCKEDVYVWKARATFANGESVTKAGDVTLLAR